MDQALIIALVLAGIWLGFLTLVVVLTIRQVGLMTVRLSAANDTASTGDMTFSVDNDGPEIGSSVPGAVASVLSQLGRERTCLLLVSATCVPCHKLVMELHKQGELPGTIALVAGRAEVADGLAALLPPEMHIVRDPQAAELANALQIQSTPFAVAIEDGRISGKAYVRRVTDFIALLEAQRRANLVEISRDQKEVVSHVV